MIAGLLWRADHDGKFTRLGRRAFGQEAASHLATQEMGGRIRRSHPATGARSVARWLVVTMLAGCANLDNGRGWGQDATLAPGWERIRSAAWKNAKDPWTWVPLVGAGVLQVDDFDRRISDWARDETPVFGSTENAMKASDNWRQVAGDLWLASVVATKSGEEAGDWAWSKTKGATVEVVAKGVSRGLTSVLKDAVGRERPNGADNRSFPSGHETEAFGSAALAARNLDSIDMPESLVLPTQIGLYTIALGTGWARVEAGAHFPADVLFAAGATNFVVGFVHDAFLGLDANPKLIVSRDPDENGWEVGLLWSR